MSDRVCFILVSTVHVGTKSWFYLTKAVSETIILRVFFCNNTTDIPFLVISPAIAFISHVDETIVQTSRTDCLFFAI